MGDGTAESDSQKRLGGIIPGTPGNHAFSLTGPEPSAIPVLIAVPHAGRAYPGSLLRALRDPESTALKLEDRLVDRIGLATAKETGATLLVANAPRAMIDLNRSPDDVDWEMFECHQRPENARDNPSHRVRSGLGLIPRRVPGLGELWKRQHQESDLTARIAGIHDPYHRTLSDALAEMRARWGTVVLLDLHSMPPIQPRGVSRPPEFVIGDRFGESCHGSLVAATFSYFDEHGRSVAHNRPYSGGYVLQRHAAPRAGIYGIQLEIDRSIYLDNELTKPGSGFAATARLLSGLVLKMAAEVTLFGEAAGHAVWREAAE